MPLVYKNNQMVEVSEEEAKSLQQLAQGQQMPATPITPVGAAAIGATPKQADMAGTKAQKVQLGQQQTATGQQRLEQARVQQTAPEQQAEQKAQKLRQLGSLESRVDDFIAQQFAQKVPTSVQLSVNQQAIAALPAEQQASMNTALTEYQAAVNANDQNAINAALVKINQATGGVLQTSDQVADYLQSASASVGGQIAGQVTDTAKLGQIDMTNLGVTDEELGQLLGPNWQEMSVGELRQQIANVRQDEFSRMNALQRELTNPATTGARRQEIMSEIRDLGATGTATQEAEMVDLERAIDEADIVEFGGQEMRLADLLADDNISGMVERYVNLPEGSEAKKQLAEQLGEGFTGWIEAHKQALGQFVEKTETANEAFQQLQESNTQARNVSNVGEVSEDLMKDLFPDYGQWSDKDYGATLKSQAWYQILSSPGNEGIPLAQKQEFLKALNSKKLDPAFAEELTKLDAASAKKLMSNPDLFMDYMSYRSQSLDPDSLTEEQKQSTDFLLDYLFGEDVSEEQIKSAVQRSKIAGKINPAAAEQAKLYTSLLDDYGQLDPTKILEYLKTNKPAEDAKTKSLLDFTKGAKLDSRYGDYAGKTDYKGSAVFNKMYDYLKNDSKIDKNEAAKLVRDPNTMYAMYNSPEYQLLDKKAKQVLEDKAWEIAYQPIDQILGSINADRAWMDQTYSKVRNYNGEDVVSKFGHPLLLASEASELKTGLGQLAKQIKSAKEPVKSKLQSRYDKLEKILDKDLEARRYLEAGPANVEKEYSADITNAERAFAQATQIHSSAVASNASYQTKENARLRLAEAQRKMNELKAERDRKVSELRDNIQSLKDEDWL